MGGAPLRERFRLPLVLDTGRRLIGWSCPVPASLGSFRWNAAADNTATQRQVNLRWAAGHARSFGGGGRPRVGNLIHRASQREFFQLDRADILAGDRVIFNQTGQETGSGQAIHGELGSE